MIGTDMGDGEVGTVHYIRTGAMFVSDTEWTFTKHLPNEFTLFSLYSLSHSLSIHLPKKAPASSYITYPHMKENVI